MTHVRRSITAALVLAALFSAACEDSPTTPTTPPTSATFVFSSQLLRQGFAWRSVTVKSTGDVKVQLVSLSPDTTAVVGLGLGTFDGSACTVTTSVETAPGSTDPQITAPVVPGNYCVKVWDVGNLTRPADFSITIVVP